MAFEGGLTRSRFLGGAASVSAAMLALPQRAAAHGARSGPWCHALTKGGRENIYDFSLDLLDGDGAIFTLSDLIGKPVWLNFFTTWCPPCNAEASDIVRIGATYAQSAHVVGIDVAEAPAKVRAFRDRHGIAFPIALDTGGSVFRGFGFHGYPTHVFLDATGAISCVSVGDLTPAQMDNELAVALARTALPQAKVPATTP